MKAPVNLSANDAYRFARELDAGKDLVWTTGASLSRCTIDEGADMHETFQEEWPALFVKARDMTAIEFQQARTSLFISMALPYIYEYFDDNNEQLPKVV
jgi:hypothetical protein